MSDKEQRLITFETLQKWCKKARWGWHMGRPGLPGYDNYAHCDHPLHWDENARSNTECNKENCPVWLGELNEIA